MKFSISALGLFALILAGCNSTTAKKPSPKYQIAGLVSKWAKLLNDRDLTSLQAMYAATVDVDGERLSRQVALDRKRQFLSANSDYHVEASMVTIDSVGPNLFLAHFEKKSLASGRNLAVEGILGFDSSGYIVQETIGKLLGSNGVVGTPTPGGRDEDLALAEHLLSLTEEHQILTAQGIVLMPGEKEGPAVYRFAYSDVSSSKNTNVAFFLVDVRNMAIWNVTSGEKVEVPMPIDSSSTDGVPLIDSTALPAR